jgi:putative transposase
LGLKVGDSESEGFWSEFIASLKERGLTGVKLLVSDAHGGFTKVSGTPSILGRQSAGN